MISLTTIDHLQKLLCKIFLLFCLNLIIGQKKFLHNNKKIKNVDNRKNFRADRKKIFSVIKNLAFDGRRAKTDERNDDRADQSHHQNVVNVQIILPQNNIGCGEPDNN